MKTKMNMRKIRAATAAVVLFVLAHPAWAVMMSMTEFTLDFTKPAEFSKKATWGAESKTVSMSQDGLSMQALGNIGQGSKQFLQNWMDRYIDWVKKHAV
jgi:hypothetical protein